MYKDSNGLVKELMIYCLAMDPIYVGSGGYTIGRVDNTIVRDPSTRLPQIPGSSVAGVWRYYTALEIHKFFKDENMRINRKERQNKEMEAIFKNDSPDWVKNFEGNRYAGIKCAGQDDAATLTLEKSKEENAGHCGHCIVCRSFGFSKRDVSWQGMLYFGDLRILFFPVFTRLGTKWITTERILREAGLCSGGIDAHTDDYAADLEKCIALDEIELENGEGKKRGYINLGWICLPYEVSQNAAELKNTLKNIYFDCTESAQHKFELEPKDIIMVHEGLFAQIVNSNLEVRTSVSIDPVTGAAKPGALFTSEAIPRGTIFYGSIRIFNKSAFKGVKSSDGKLDCSQLPSVEYIEGALRDSKHFFESLGVGGMTTRGFGRMCVNIKGVGCEAKTSGASSGENHGRDTQQSGGVSKNE